MLVSIDFIQKVLTLLTTLAALLTALIPKSLRMNRRWITSGIIGVVLVLVGAAGLLTLTLPSDKERRYDKVTEVLQQYDPYDPVVFAESNGEPLEIARISDGSPGSWRI